MVTVAGKRLGLGRAAANEYVVATLSTARSEVTVRRDGRLVSRWAFPPPSAWYNRSALAEAERGCVSDVMAVSI